MKILKFCFYKSNLEDSSNLIISIVINLKCLFI